MRTVTYLGYIGAVGIGLLRPLVLTVERDGGGVWNLTGYDQPTLLVWDLRTGNTVAITGALAITDAVNGEATYTPAVGDPIFGTSGTFEARCTFRPGSGAPEPSGIFRFSIAGR